MSVRLSARPSVLGQPCYFKPAWDSRTGSGTVGSSMPRFFAETRVGNGHNHQTRHGRLSIGCTCTPLHRAGLLSSVAARMAAFATSLRALVRDCHVVRLVNNFCSSWTEWTLCCSYHIEPCNKIIGLMAALYESDFDTSRLRIFYSY